MSGAWCPVPGARCLVPGARCLVPGACHLPSAMCPRLGRPASGVRHLVPGAWCLLPVAVPDTEALRETSPVQTVFLRPKLLDRPLRGLLLGLYA